MINPMQESSEEEIKQLTGASYTLPEMAENVNCFIYKLSDGDMGEIQYTYVDAECSLRMQKRSEYADISGMEFEWNLIEYGSLGDCSEQNMTFVGDGEAAQVCIWYDEVNDVMYSVSAYATDLDGFDIVSMASDISGLEFVSLMQNEVFMPNDFLQEREGRDIFASYDEMISLLNPGEAYTYITMEGYDGELLVISDVTYEYEEQNVTLAAYVYANINDGTVKNIGNMFSMGTAYPIRCDGTYLYTAGNHMYECDAIADSSEPALMVKETISELYSGEGDDAVAEYSGFIRQSRSIDEDGEEVDITTQDEFYAYCDKYLNADAISFTVVE